MSDLSQYSVLVSGAGSVGKRHTANLRRAGIQRLAVCDPDIQRLNAVVDELKIEPFPDFGAALAIVKPDLVFVCTPPVFHVVQARAAVRVGAHVFIEKPLSDRLEGIDQLTTEADARGRIVQVGYNLRFHPGIRKLKDFIDTGALGRILWARAEAGQYLPDWRPWQDYRQSYTARKELGGGILLDGSHELDYITWLLGKPVEVLSMAGKVSTLDVDVEDCASVLLRFASGCQADVHLDFVQRGYCRSCKLVGEKGTAAWDFTSSEVKLLSAETGVWKGFAYDFDTNDMYVSEVRDFVRCVDCGERPVVDLRQATEVLKLVLAAKKSAARGCTELLV